MKQAHIFVALALMLLVIGCSRCSPPPAAPEPTNPAAPEQSAPPEASPPEATLSASEREALHASGRALVERFVNAFSRGDTAVAETMFVSESAFEAIVTPSFRNILGAGLLARNKQELANLAEALKGRKVESWEWKPGKLTKTSRESAFVRSLVQISGGTIELQVDGTFMAVSIDQMVQLDGKWAIFQMHNL